MTPFPQRIGCHIEPLVCKCPPGVGRTQTELIHILKRAPVRLCENSCQFLLSGNIFHSETCCIVSMICGQSYFTLSEKEGEGRSHWGLCKTCYPRLNRNPIAGLFSPSLFVRSPCLWNPLCCLMGSWPQGRGYSLSFLQLAFTVSLAELMHHIFEDQVSLCASGWLRSKV